MNTVRAREKDKVSLEFDSATKKLKLTVEDYVRYGPGGMYEMFAKVSHVYKSTKLALFSFKLMIGPASYTWRKQFIKRYMSGRTG